MQAPLIDPFLPRTRIAYFSMEMAVRPEMHTYAGGLGVLAGDTARSCADLEIPAVFVTLLSRAGYFRQAVDADGRQTKSQTGGSRNASARRSTPWWRSRSRRSRFGFDPGFMCIPARTAIRSRLCSLIASLIKTAPKSAR